MGQVWVGHWVCLLGLVGLALALWTIFRQRGLQAAERWRERRMREELEAYAHIETSRLGEHGVMTDPAEASRDLARRICRLVAEKSVFGRVTMLLRNAEGRFVCIGSIGVDDLTVAALTNWGEKIVAEERATRAVRSIRTTAKSFSIQLGDWSDFDREVGTWALSGKRERRKWRRAIVVPIRVGSGKMAGAIVVCGDGTALADGIEKATSPIETLAARLGREFENETLRERLLRAEKLAGLGQLAGGVAHALNNPLTAVLGFAELIAETSEESRVRKDANTIVLEARKMKETVEKLVEFWRPVPPTDEVISVTGILRELAAACHPKLKERGVTLILSAGTDVPAVRGSRDRLRQVMEHLLNNAAQTIATARPREEGEEHAIRITVSHDERTLHIIVSDTGPGFRDPARIFDPFYSTRGPEEGSGMGLSICYGIVREHGGEVSAFNLHPHGAAVVIELPISKVIREPILIEEDGLVTTENKA
jgi:signal transduction histidine kinase